jgi:membrane protease YdiL (CAAX protease family)
VAYFQDLRDDLRRILGQPDLLIIATVVALSVVLARYLPPMVRVPDAWCAPVGFALRNLIFLALPLLSLPLLRRPVSDFGLTLGVPRKWLVDIAVLYAVMLPVVVIASRHPSFRAVYPYFAFERQGPALLLAGLGLRLFGMFAWEFLLRGYLLFGFEPRVGPAPAIAVQLVPFVLLHFGKPVLEVHASIIAGVALGIVAVRARSFIPCVLLHFAVAATLDILALLPA